MNSRNRRIKAANTIGATFRSYQQRRVYVTFLRAIICLQAIQRGKMALEMTMKLRDPFCKLSFKDCKNLLKKQEKLLEVAVAQKDFTAAAKLEEKM